MKTTTKTNAIKQNRMKQKYLNITKYKKTEFK